MAVGTAVVGTNLLANVAGVAVVANCNGAAIFRSVGLGLKPNQAIELGMAS